jgi:hypothetical protein
MMRLLIAIVLLSVGAHAQWVGYKVAGVPRMSDGKPNLKAPVPRVNGKPDLSGIWMPIPAKIGEAVELVPVEGDLAVPGDDARQMSKYFFSTLADYKLEDIMTPAGIQKWQSGGRPTPACTTDTPPMMGVIPAPQRWVQTPQLLAILSEGSLPRLVHMDGRPLPVDPQPAYLGYSVGRWDRDTLVVETIGIKEQAPLDAFGHPRTSSARLTERFRRLDYGHLEVRVTIEDPAYYKKPVSYQYSKILTPDDDFLEYVCAENERDAEHLRQIPLPTEK